MGHNLQFKNQIELFLMQIIYFTGKKKFTDLKFILRVLCDHDCELGSKNVKEQCRVQTKVASLTHKMKTFRKGIT